MEEMEVWRKNLPALFDGIESIGAVDSSFPRPWFLNGWHGKWQMVF